MCVREGGCAAQRVWIRRGVMMGDAVISVDVHHVGAEQTGTMPEIPFYIPHLPFRQVGCILPAGRSSLRHNNHLTAMTSLLLGMCTPGTPEILCSPGRSSPDKPSPHTVPCNACHPPPAHSVMKDRRVCVVLYVCHFLIKLLRV